MISFNIRTKALSIAMIPVASGDRVSVTSGVKDMQRRVFSLENC